MLGGKKKEKKMLCIQQSIHEMMTRVRHSFRFGLVLWHINHCRLFNAKSFLYIYIKYMICKHFVDNILKGV